MARIPKNSSLYPKIMPRNSTIVIMIKTAYDMYGSDIV